jgi:DNA-binding response OmpR family regulator
MGIILVVDDEPVVRGFLCDLLEDENQVLSAQNGQEGLLIAQSTKLDLIITDLEMPIMNGQEMVKILRSQSRFSNLPIIAISSRFLIPTDKLNMLSLGANYCLPKPVNSNILQKLIRKLLKETSEYLPLDIANSELVNMAFLLEKQQSLNLEQ